MKNIFYLNCNFDPWYKVAQKLSEEYQFKPVYWVGYMEDGSDKAIPELFPNIIYQRDLPDAWRGVFPKLIKENAQNVTLDIDFLNRFASQELQAIKMMDRIDIKRNTFSFMERQRHWRNLVRNWSAAIDLLRPDLVVTPMLPHRVYDYALYCLCQYKGIPFLAFNHTQFNGRFMVLDQIFSIGDLYKEDYLCSLTVDSEELYKSLMEDVKDRFDKVKGDYTGAAPYYMATEARQQEKNNNIFHVLKSRIGSLWTYRASLFGELPDSSVCYYKFTHKKSLEEKKSINVFKYYPIKIENKCYLKKLKSIYESLTIKPDYSGPYVVYFLHYQPEATTSPTGDIFVDQSLCIDMLLKNTPKEWSIYVKEHPHQFMYHREGATSRIKEFYLDLTRNPRVKLMSINESSFDLIEHCKAIGTVCGTVGWETIVRGKPVILFGLSWYENYTPGVLRITDETSAHNMTDFINNYKFDEHSLLAYLASVGKNTRLAYYYKATHKSTLGISEDECVNNIVDAIIKKYNEIKY